MNIILPQSKLLSRQNKEIPTMLNILSGTRNRLSCGRVSLGTSSIIIGAHAGSTTQLDYRMWRFPTLVSSLKGNYFEQWLDVGNNNSWYLEKAYFHIYKYYNQTEKEKEIIALHCDPNEPIDPQYKHRHRYKCGPHIHVTVTPTPMHKTHFALNLANIKNVTSDYDELMKAFKDGLIMIKEEFLDRINEEGGNYLV